MALQNRCTLKFNIIKLNIYKEEPAQKAGFFLASTKSSPQGVLRTKQRT
jgi:hypothetical protein